MRSLFGKLGIVTASFVALFGISAGKLHATTSDINDKTPLYLEHGKQMPGSVLSDHESHYSHSSHESHHSHHSGY
jgi:hypothetical protein